MGALMSLQFDDTGFTIPDTETVRESVRQSWINAFAAPGQPTLNTEPETPAGQLIDSQTAAITEADSELLYIAQQFDPAINSGVFQDAIGRIYYLTRKPAVPSQAVITVTGLPGTVIPVTAQIRSTEDQTLWGAAEAVTIPAEGVASVRFVCMTPGAITAAAGTLTRIVTVVAGWDTATNEAAAAVGNLAENRGQFESRRYASVAVNSRSVAASVYGRIMQLSDVIACYVTQNRGNVPKVVDGYTLKPHSVYVAVVGGDDEEIAQALYDTVSAGCDYNGNTAIEITDPNTGAVETVLFQRPDDLPVRIMVTLVGSVDDLPADYVAQIRTAIFNNFYGLDSEIILDGQPIPRVTMDTTLFASRFPVSVYNLGIRNVGSIKVAKGSGAWSDQIRIGLNESPSLQESDIIVGVVSL